MRFAMFLPLVVQDLGVVESLELGAVANSHCFVVLLPLVVSLPAVVESLKPGVVASSHLS